MKVEILYICIAGISNLSAVNNCFIFATHHYMPAVTCLFVIRVQLPQYMRRHHLTPRLIEETFVNIYYPHCTIKYSVLMIYANNNNNNNWMFKLQLKKSEISLMHTAYNFYSGDTKHYMSLP